MSPLTPVPPATEVYGESRIRDHCNFAWKEAEGTRIVDIRSWHCDSCVRELLADASRNGLSLVANIVARDEEVRRVTQERPAPGTSILVVEDDSDVRETLSFVLAENGYEVVTARDGRQALDLLREGLRPALVLLDLMMPELDGWDFRRIQLGERSLAGIPVVVVTASKHLRDQPIAAQGILRKPVSMDQLLDVVRAHLGAAA